MKLLIGLILFLSINVSVASNLSISPKLKKVELEQFTSLNVELVPDLGTRFIFPFVLDESDDFIPFTLDITNPLFISTRHAGRNSFTIEIDPPEEGGQLPTYLGNMFVSVGGYNLSIVLSTTNSLKRHVSDYVFELSDKAREDLIQEAIVKRTKSLEESYQQKLSEIDDKASIIALRKIGNLALSDPDEDPIKEESTLELDTGEKVILYLSEVLIYGKKYKLFTYEVTNDTTEDLKVVDAVLLTIDKNGLQQKLFTANSIMSRIKPGDTHKGVITTDSPAVDNKALNIRLSLLTSAGLVEVDWE